MCFSARNNNNNERAAAEPRNRDREARQREQEAIVIAIRRHAVEHQRVRGAVENVVVRPGSPRAAGTSHGTKRKVDTTFGTETVEQWASTEVRLVQFIIYYKAYCIG